MISQSLIDHTLKFNPSVEQLNQMADALEARAQEHLTMARKSQAQRLAAPCVRHSQIYLDMIDTAKAFRDMVVEAAQYLATPDWAIEAETYYKADQEAEHITTAVA